MQLNNIKIKHQASQIAAMDWTKGVAVVQLPNGGFGVVSFDPADAADRKLAPLARRLRSAAPQSM
jgi:hypothetical protein